MRLVFLSAVHAQGVPEWRKIAPPSPDVVSLGSYGETPVSLYTGTPNINIPIYEINSGRLKLPISLSYSAKGIKVEEIASLVGLGWSLNAGGIITRVVHGNPDETGFMMPFSVNPSVHDILSHWPASYFQINPGPGTLDPSVLDPEFITESRNLVKGVHDGEADMFYYNFGSYSGKFFYDPEKGDIVSIPQNNILFDKQYFLANQQWRVVTPDGVEYFFELPEINTSKSACNGSSSGDRMTTTGWFLTRIQDITSHGSITLNYSQYLYSSDNIASITLNQSDAGSIIRCVPSQQKCVSQNNYNTQRLTSITYDNGKVEFVSNTDRCDLPGTKALDSIKIYSNNATHLSTFRFDYGYFNKNSSTPCSTNDQYLTRLKLKALYKIAPDGREQPPHKFAYNESLPLPSRMSYNQDMWGYYNHSNNDNSQYGMVPPWTNIYSAIPISWPGGDRVVDTVYTGLGNIKKITYPTGGSTTYTFENHRTSTYNEYATSPYRYERYEQLYATNLRGSRIFKKQIVVNNQQGGGVYMSVAVANSMCYDCNASPPPPLTTCSQLSLDRADGGPSTILRCSLERLMVPNGTYILTADFSGAPDSSYYESFSIQLRWDEFNKPADAAWEFAIGGLRIKKITDDDGFGNLKTREYQYSGGYLSYDKTDCVYDMGCIPASTDTPPVSLPSITFHVRQSYSNIPLGGSPSSTFGYQTVVEKRTSDAGSTGKSVYTYTAANVHPDDVITLYPYGEPLSFDHRRGLLLKQEDYALENNLFRKVHSIENEYAPLDAVNFEDWQYPYDLNVTDSLFHEVLNVRAVNLDIWANGTEPYPWVMIFKTITEWIRQTKSTERTYDVNGNYIEKTTLYEYANPSHQQATKITQSRSDGTNETTRFKYPLDYSSNSDLTGLSTWSRIQYLQSKHHVTDLVETTSTRETGPGAEEVTGGSFVAYNGMLLPSTVYSLELDKPMPFTAFQQSAKGSIYKPKLFLDYELEKGQLIQQQKHSDISSSYVWGYGKSLPIAEATNATPAQIFHTSFEDADYGPIGTIGTAVTGERYFSGSSYTIAMQNQPTGSNLKMTYWYYKNSQWNLKSETDYTATISEPGATAYDEIRVYPANALMTTYCHKPGVGVSSVMDANNRITSYEYDSFGRVVVIRDNDKKIVKAYQYHYKDQTTGN